MSELPPPAPPPPAPPPDPARERRNRRWFVILAWITLVGFGIFTAAITVLAFLLRDIARAGGR